MRVSKPTALFVLFGYAVLCWCLYVSTKTMDTQRNMIRFMLGACSISVR